MTGGCGVYRSLGVTERCGKAVAETVVTGCVHEHIETTPACAACAARLRAGTMFCAPCYDAPAGSHLCRAQPLPVDDLAPRPS